ncbi:MAG: hypothetical protein JWP66_421 [Naasia sp.]|nr:hypothetical protein [Naasia sp.]
MLNRRELERLAFGPDASEEDRLRARDELDRLTAPALALVPAGAPAIAAPAHPSAVPASEPSPSAAERAGASAAGRPPRQENRRLRRAALAGGALLGLIAAAVLIPSALEPSSLDVFQQEQTDADRDTPDDVANAVAAGAIASAEPGAGAALYSSLRALNAPGVSAFAFTDGHVVCLAAALRIECASAADFRRDGIFLAVDDPGTGGREISWGPKGDLRVRSDPGILEPRGTDLPQLRRLCMIGHDFDVSTTPRGDLRAGQGVDTGALDYAMARLDCAIRYGSARD